MKQAAKLKRKKLMHQIAVMSGCRDRAKNYDFKDLWQSKIDQLNKKLTHLQVVNTPIGSSPTIKKGSRH